jgi:type I protein arginine methyltransferase
MSTSRHLRLTVSFHMFRILGCFIVLTNVAAFFRLPPISRNLPKSPLVGAVAQSVLKSRRINMAEFAEDGSSIMKGGEAEKASDFANYFCSYAFLYHQKQMLMDNVRMKAYHNAIMENKSLFEGKVVLDVGTGSGVLAIWAAQAGAAKVYAVEYTDMAVHARKMVEQNGVSGIVEVIQSSVEDLELPCKVDIIVSEWMGYFLLRESMLDSVIRARNKWMKPEGSMFPSHATMYWSAVSNEQDREGRYNDYTGAMQEWVKFGQDMKSKYAIDCSAISSAYQKEQIDYFIYSSLWTELRVEDAIGEPVVVKRLDLNTCTLADAEGVTKTPYKINIPFPITISGSPTVHKSA